MNSRIRHRGFRYRHDSLLRQRLIRDNLNYSRTLFVDRDDISPHIIQAANEQTSISYELTFAPLAPVSRANNSLIQAIPAGEEGSDYSEASDTSDTTSDTSESPTIEVNLDDPSGRIILGLLNAWERDAEIR